MPRSNYARHAKAKLLLLAKSDLIYVKARALAADDPLDKLGLQNVSQWLLLAPLETCPTGTENVRSSGVDQKSPVYGQTDATGPHQTLAIRCCRADKNSRERIIYMILTQINARTKGC
jgi:hypothetical protein